MAVGSGTSFVISSMLVVVLFSGMQVYKNWLAATAFRTILGGYLSSMLFVLVLTAVGNMESSLFGKGFQAKLFPEIFFCFGISILTASMIHRVCVTTCILFSILALYYMNKLSQKVHTSPVVVNVQGKKKKGN